MKGFFVLAILTSLAAEASNRQTSTVQVRAYTRIFDGGNTSLLDIVEQTQLPSEIEKKLAAVTLGDAPKVGEQRVYTNAAIADAIRRTLDKKALNFKIPHQVVVENRGYQLDRDSIEKELVQRWQKLCSECQIRILNLQLPAVPQWVNESPWTLPTEDLTRLPRGHFSQRLSAVAPNSRPQIFWINGQIEVKRKVPVLNRSTPMGTRLTEEDFEMSWRDVTQATDSTPAPKEIAGQQAKFTMNANDIIWRGSLVREKAVRRGEMVKVVTGEEGWEISLQARTEQDGFIGDSVNLRNLQTNKVITGRVTAVGEVEIR